MTNRQLHSKSGFYDFIRKCIPNIKRMSDAEVEVFIKCNNLESLKSAYEHLKKCEIKRRNKRKEFCRFHKRKGVRIWQE